MKTRIAVLSLLLAFVFLYATQAQADLVAVADTGGIRITLYDDPCELKEVSNLPHKATWEEKGKVFKGCWNAHPGGFVVTYWLEDRTVGIVPGRVFTKANGV